AISHEHLIRFYYSMSARSFDPKAKEYNFLEAAEKTFLAFANTLHIDLSPDAQRQLAEVQAQPHDRSRQYAKSG
ncbi:hypothetical protein, partial [Endozoicomonas numazuensis]